MIATVTLNPSIDREFLVKELVKDDAIRAMRVVDTAGGKGVNVSKVVRELGGKTLAFALTGGLEGKLYAERIQELDFPYRLLAIKGRTRLNIILTDHDDGTQTRVSAPGPRVTRVEWRRFMAMILRVRPAPYAWVLGGTLPAHMDDAAYYRLIHALQVRAQARCVVDTDGEALRRAVEAKPFMIKPNEFELARLMGGSFKKESEYAKAARELVGRGIGIVIVSLGARGAVFASSEHLFYIPAMRIKTRSKVGAGDSLIAGVLTGLERGWALDDAARLGMAASHSAVIHGGPRLCIKADIPRLFNRFHIRRVI